LSLNNQGFFGMPNHPRKLKIAGVEEEQAQSLGVCPICGRIMLAGNSVDRHHWRPKSQGGTISDWLHRTCHRKLHSLFSDRDLARRFATPEKVRQHPDMQTFIRWVRRQPPERVVRHRQPRRPK
jgi:hypothetical protein